LREGSVFFLNGVNLSLGSGNNLSVKNQYGINKYTLRKFIFRYEYFFTKHTFNSLDLSKLNKFDWSVMRDSIRPNIPDHAHTKDKKLIRLFLLDYLTTYKGFRHLYGYPTNGQRTRSNGNNCRLCNNMLKNFKISAAKKYYGNLPFHELNIAILAETVNLT